MEIEFSDIVYRKRRGNENNIGNANKYNPK